MEAALVGILGAILGFATSYILEGRKRKWEREDRQREMRREELEELSSNSVKLVTSFRDIVLNSQEITPRVKDEIKKIHSEFMITRTPGYDDELDECIEILWFNSKFLFSQDDDAPKTKEEFKNVFETLDGDVVGLQIRISQLIDETYK